MPSHRSRRGPRPRLTRRPLRPRFEDLEARRVPATIVVTAAGDAIAVDGFVTLREAITAANENKASGDAKAGSAGLDRIEFDFGDDSLHTILPASPLPTIIEPIEIDGYTQGGSKANGNPITAGSNAVLHVQIDGSASGASAGLALAAPGCVVRGLIINKFTGGARGSASGSGRSRRAAAWPGTSWARTRRAGRRRATSSGSSPWGRTTPSAGPRRPTAT